MILTSFVKSPSKWRNGNFISRVGRVIFESNQIRKAVGLGLIFTMVSLGTFTPVFGAEANAGTGEQIITQPQKVLTTQTTFQKSVGGEISQVYHWYHQGIDIAGNAGQEVHAIASGQIKEIGYQFFGYGNYITVSHGSDLTSLYAHLSKINVTVGQEVNKDTVIGVVGSTGRSTGPHLHLEIAQNGLTIDPVSVIGNY